MNNKTSHQAKMNFSPSPQKHTELLSKNKILRNWLLEMIATSIA